MMDRNELDDALNGFCSIEGCEAAVEHVTADGRTACAFHALEVTFNAALEVMADTVKRGGK